MADWAHTIKAVAFDMDGLMVNTEELYTEVSQQMLARRGRTFTTELKNQMMGLPGQQAFEVMIEAEQLTDSVDELAAETAQLFADLLPGKLAVLPGLVPLLDHLDHRQVPRCVATSSTRDFAQLVLGQVRLLQRVDFVVTAEDVPRGKPHPDIYLAAAEQMSVEAPQVLVLEDSHHGSRAAISAGACTVAVPGEHSADHDFSGVHLIADTLADDRIMQLL